MYLQQAVKVVGNANTDGVPCDIHIGWWTAASGNGGRTPPPVGCAFGIGEVSFRLCGGVGPARALQQNPYESMKYLHMSAGRTEIGDVHHKGEVPTGA